MSNATFAAQRLAAARRAVEGAQESLQSINQRSHALDAREARLRDAAAVEQAPRQEKRSLLAAILRRGAEPTPKEEQQLIELDRRIASAASSDAADEQQVIAELRAELQHEVEEVYARMKLLQAGLIEAQFEAARDEIEGPMMQRFMLAAEAFRAAYGDLVGLGVAHNMLGARARELGAQCGNAAGADLMSAVKAVVLPMPGFGHALPREASAPIRIHGHMQLVLDASREINATAQSALERWQRA